MKIPLEVDIAVLGKAVFRALAASFGVVEYPKNPDEEFSDLAEMAGFISWSEFARDARCLQIDSDDATVTLSPMKHYNAAGGFIGVDNVEFKLPATAPPEELGKAIKQAIQFCDR